MKYYFLFLDYVNLKRTFSLLPDYDSLNESFVVLSSYFPLLTLHYINFMLLVKPDTIGKVRSYVCMYVLTLFIWYNDLFPLFRLKMCCVTIAPVQVLC